MSGWNDLGDLLGGGLENRKEQAFQNGRYRSAQTEDALTNARVNQAKALQVEAENQSRADYAAAQAAGGIDYANPTSSMITQALLGGLAPQLEAAGKYNLGAQEFRHRDVLADPNASALDRTRAGNSIQGKNEGDIKQVGTRGYYNLTDDTPELSVMAGLDEPTPAIKNFEYRNGLKDPAAQTAFDQQVRQDRIVNAGGVPYVLPGVNPNGTGPKQVVSTGETANNASTIAGGKTTAVTQAKLAVALPGVVESLDTFSKGIDDFLNAPGFDMVYGKSGAAAKAMGPLAPEDYRNAHAVYDNLKSEAFQNSVQKMRGLGSLSNAEGEKVQAALTAALDENQDEAQAAQSFKLLKTRLERFRKIAELEAGFKGTGVQVGPGAAPQTNPGVSAPREFATEADAQAAGVQPGEKVIIGGVSGTWE
jgi:hypothetical protein